MRIAVYGASGHTGRFVLAELLRRGHSPIAVGRREANLAQTRVAPLDSPELLDRAFAGTDAIINCAGPFLDTAEPLIEAALRCRVHYFDVTAEQTSALATFEHFDLPARKRGIVVAPAAGFFGGLGDLAATYAMDDWKRAERIEIAIALDTWWPTLGTRRTGARNTAPRLVLSGAALKPMQPSPSAIWRFPQPFGAQRVVELPLTETILISHHVQVSDVHNYINETPLRDLHDPATPEPVAVDEYGRSNQHFVIEAVVRNGDQERRATVSGRDIYAVTAPIVVEAVERIGREARRDAGAFALAELFDAGAFLDALRESEGLVFGHTFPGAHKPGDLRIAK